MRRIVRWGFAAGTHYATLAERLAHRFGGVAIHLTKGPIRIEELVVLADSTELDVLVSQISRLDVGQIRVLAIESDPLLLSRVFPEAPVVPVGASDPEWLWQAAIEACTGEAGSVPGRRFPRTFLSHAVADETLLMPAVDYLRRITDSSFFFCADSIDMGDAWYPTIIERLGHAERMVFVLSEASAQSTFCAFEIGQAMARSCPIGVVAIDDTAPPAYLQHLQVVQVDRLQRLRPWLSTEEALIEAILQGCA